MLEEVKAWRSVTTRPLIYRVHLSVGKYKEYLAECKAIVLVFQIKCVAVYTLESRFENVWLQEGEDCADINVLSSKEAFSKFVRGELWKVWSSRPPERGLVHGVDVPRQTGIRSRTELLS